METRWYLKPGQVLEKTKISERSRALHASRTEWQKLIRHLDRKRLAQENIENAERRKLEMKEASYNMTKNWDNSVENTSKRWVEAREERLKKKEDDLMENFFKLRDEQAQVRQQYVEKVHRAMFEEKTYPKAVNNAQVFSEMLYEREKQIEFKKTMKEHERKMEEEYAAKVKREAEEEAQEKMEEKIQKIKKQEETKKIYSEQMADNRRRKQKEFDERRKLETDDNVKAVREMELIKKCEKEEMEEKKQDCKREFWDFLDKQNKAKERAKLEEEEYNRVVDMLSQFRDRFEGLSKYKKQQMIEESLQRGIAATKAAFANAKSKGDQEAKTLAAQLKAKEMADEEEQLRKDEYQKRLKKERQDDIEQRKKRNEIDLMKKKEYQKWEMVNRYKQNELFKEHDHKIEVDKWNSVLNYRQELLDQMVRDNERRKQIKLEKEFSPQDWETEDKMFFEFAEKVIKEAEAKGRATAPIWRVVEEYKKENLLAKPKEPKPCTKHGKV